MPSASIVQTKNINQLLERSLSYCTGLGWRLGPWLVASIGYARFSRRPFLDLPVPGSRRTVRVRPNSSDITLYTQIFARREYQMDDMLQARDLGFDDLDAKPLTIVDCGANIGLSTVWFATKFPKASVIAIEPARENVDMMEHNVAPLGNVRIIHAAVWNTKTQVVISNPDALAHAFQTRATDADSVPKDEAISTVTIDEFVKPDSDRRYIVKIDIEGAEATVFERNIDWLQYVDLLIIELHDWMIPWEGTSRSVMKAAVELGFEFILRGENLFCFRRVTARSRRMLDGVTVPSAG